MLLRYGANPTIRDDKYCATPAGWARYAGHTAVRDAILQGPIDVFDAIDHDRSDRIPAILDRDPDALTRTFGSYASCGDRPNQWWPRADQSPLSWAVDKQMAGAVQILTERGADAASHEHARLAAQFLQFACWDHHTHGKGDHRMYDRAAGRLLEQAPEVARANLYTAIGCGEVEHVEKSSRTVRSVIERGGDAGGNSVYLAAPFHNAGRSKCGPCRWSGVPHPSV